MDKPKLQFLVGLPRCGKSTYSNKWREENINNGVVVNGDSIRLAMTGQRFNKHAESLVHATKYVMIKTLLLQGYNVLVDGTNTSKESIRRLLEIDIDAEPIFFLGVNPNVCMERALKTGQADLLSPIKRMSNNLSQLLCERFWEFPDIAEQKYRQVMEDVKKWCYSEYMIVQ